MENGVPEEGMGVYMDDYSVLKAAYKAFLREMKGLRLTPEEKISCINDYLKLDAAVTEELMRKKIKNYDEAVSRRALTFKDIGKYWTKFNEKMPFRFYSMLWALDREDMKDGSDEYAREKAREHFNNLKNPEFILKELFSDF